MDYKNSKIYRIVCNETGETYIGSTTQPLTKRLSKHKENFKYFLQGKYSANLASFPIIERGNYDIVLIEEFPCENKSQLHARERYYIETCICVNKNIPSRTKQEYYIDNKDVILEKRHKYNIEKKEQITEKFKKYYEKNKDEINRRRRDKYHLSKI